MGGEVGVMLTTYRYLVPRLRMGGAIPLLLHTPYDMHRNLLPYMANVPTDRTTGYSILFDNGIFILFKTYLERRDVQIYDVVTQK